MPRGGPVPQDSLNRLQENLVRIVAADGDAFETVYGRTARRFLDKLPVLFPVMRRAAMDITLPAEVRRLAAVSVLYVSEPDDFMSEAQFGVRSLLDDCCALFLAFHRARRLVPDSSFQRHIRVDGVYDELSALADNIGSMTALLSSKVLEQLEALLANEPV